MKQAVKGSHLHVPPHWRWGGERFDEGNQNSQSTSKPPVAALNQLLVVPHGTTSPHPGGGEGMSQSGGPQQTHKLSDLAEGVVRGAYAGLKTTLEALPSTHQTQRSKSLLKYVHAQKQKILRLRVLVQWANQALAVNVCAKAWGVASSHSDAFRFAADHMAYLHDELLHLAVPVFDVHTAWEILTKGQYSRLPAIIDEICPPKPLSNLERSRALNKLDFRILCFLKRVQLPEEMKVLSVSEGKTTLWSKGEYKADVTLVQAPDYLIQKLNFRSKNYAGKDSHRTGPSSLEGSNDTTTEITTEVGSDQDQVIKVLEEGHWWWRLMNLELLAGGISAVVYVKMDCHYMRRESPKGPPLHPEHLEVLKQEIDIRMCMTQEASTINALNICPGSENLVAENGTNTTMEKTEEKFSVEKGNEGKNTALSNFVDERKKANRKRKIDQHHSCLSLVHEMVREVSTRLLLSAVRKELCQLVGKNCVWENKLKLAVATHLKPGYRLYYWMDTPLVTESMLQGESPGSNGPYLEIGANEDGRVVMEHFPPLPLNQTVCETDLNLGSLDVGLMVLRAAAANSTVIMEVLCDSLKRVAASSGSPKEVTYQPWEEALVTRSGSELPRSESAHQQHSNFRDVGSPSIALYDQGKLILKVHCHLLDGSLALEAGNSISQDLTPQVVEKLSVEEDRVNQSWKQWSRDVPADSGTNPTIAAYNKVASKLWLVAGQLYHLVQRDIEFELAHSAKKFAKQWSTFAMEARMLEEYSGQNPNCAIGKGRHIQMPVQSFSLPKSFPQLAASPCADTQKGPGTFNEGGVGGVPDSSMKNPLTGPRPVKDLSCYLNKNLDAEKDSEHLSMVVFGVDAWGVPVEIVNCLPVPDLETRKQEEQSMSPCVDRTDEVPVSGKIKPRKCTEKRKMSFEDSEIDVLRMKRPCRTISIDSLKENGSLLEDLNLSCILDSDDDLPITEANGTSPRHREHRACSTAQEPADPDVLAVHWCRRRFLWEHIVFQMLALGVPFLEECEPGLSDGFCARIVGWQPVDINQKTVSKSCSPQPPRQEASRADMCFGFRDLQSVHVQVALDSDIGKWAIRIKSSAFAHSCRSGLKCKLKGVRLRIDEDCIELEYSALEGATVATALDDLMRLAHTQEFIASLRKTVRASGHGFEDSLAWYWPSSCSIQVDELGLSHVVFRVDPCGGLHDKHKHTTPRNGSDQCDLVTSVIYRLEFLPNSFKENAKHSDSDFLSTDPRETMLKGFPGHGSVRRVVYHLTSIPSFPIEFLRELCCMIEAGEPGLFLDAIAATSSSLLTIGQALSPSNFQAARLSPGLLSLAPSDPPYSFKLLFAKGEKNLAMDVRLFSNGVSYFGIHQPRIGGGESPQGMSSLQNNDSDGGDEVSSITLDMVQVLQRFADRVKDFPGVQLSHRHHGDCYRGSKLAGFGLWCQQRVIPKILKEYIGCVAHR